MAAGQKLEARALLDDAYVWWAGLLKWGGDALLLLLEVSAREARALAPRAPGPAAAEHSENAAADAAIRGAARKSWSAQVLKVCILNMVIKRTFNIP